MTRQFCVVQRLLQLTQPQNQQLVVAALAAAALAAAATAVRRQPASHRRSLSL
jgi:hypothetical protein